MAKNFTPQRYCRGREKREREKREREIKDTYKPLGDIDSKIICSGSSVEEKLDLQSDKYEFIFKAKLSK